MGTGCNAAVPMKPHALQTEKVEYAARGRHVEEIVVNTECTLRGVGETLRGLDIFTKWDVALDQALSIPGFQPFEYLSAGSYLGEIIRLLAYDYFTHKVGFAEGDLPRNLVQRNALNTTFLGHTVATTTDTQSLAADLNASTELGSTSSFTWTPDFAAVLIRIERAVLGRSAALIAAAIVALLVSTGEVTLQHQHQHQDQQPLNDRHVPPPSSTTLSSNYFVPQRELVVAYCGGLICLYPNYREQILATINRLLEAIIVESGSTTVTLREASAGGVIGAGVLAGTVWPC